MTYEELLTLSDSKNLIVKEKEFPGYGGRIYKNRIAINRSLPTRAEKSCVLAEEIGHHYTTTGNILNQSDIVNRRQEFLAEAIQCYKSKYGACATVDNYIICFEPFAVMKVIAVE